MLPAEATDFTFKKRAAFNEFGIIISMIYYAYKDI
ncbi:hypothetical protein SAMN05421797_1036 [Maribacter ulvicola]|uniref:Uncharacterized protein n=1 Tax=Maribacter ulvicola TaxID=228959 RepID=A0A1N6V673_9FLAO|nr:hypothetical protein SAMN05421797_1036 [Maribacter ulvicola]